MTSRGKMFKWLKESCRFKRSELEIMDDLTVLDPLFNLLLALSDDEECKLILTMIATRLHSILLTSNTSQSGWMESKQRIYMIMKYFENMRVLGDEPIVSLSNINEFTIIINFKMAMQITIYSIIIHHDRVSVTVKENY